MGAGNQKANRTTSNNGTISEDQTPISQKGDNLNNFGNAYKNHLQNQINTQNSEPNQVQNDPKPVNNIPQPIIQSNISNAPVLKNNNTRDPVESRAVTQNVEPVVQNVQNGSTNPQEILQNRQKSYSNHSKYIGIV